MHTRLPRAKALLLASWATLCAAREPQRLGVSSVRLVPVPTGREVAIELSGEPRGVAHFVLEDPPRIVLDVQAGEGGAQPGAFQFPVADAVVLRGRAAAHGTVLRVVLDLAQAAQVRAVHSQGTQIVVALVESISARLRLSGRAVAETEGGERQRPGAVAGLVIDAAPSATTAVHLDARGSGGGPFEGGRAGVYDWAHAFQNYSPALDVREAYLEWLRDELGIRGGLQRFTWGVLGRQSPLDIVNPRSYHDPFLDTDDESKLGVPAFTTTVSLPDLPGLRLDHLDAQLALIPLAVPPRLALAAERWFPPTVLPEGQIVLGVAGLLGNPLVPIERLTQNHRPPRRLDAGGLAFRLGGEWPATRWHLYHYSGPETRPYATLAADLVSDGLTFDHLRVLARLRQAHTTIHLTGVDWQVLLGSGALLGELAYVQDRPFQRPAADLTDAHMDSVALLTRLQDPRNRGRVSLPLGELFPTHDSFEWGIGWAQSWQGLEARVRVLQTVALGGEPRLLIHVPETRPGLETRLRTPLPRVTVALSGEDALERHAWWVLPRAIWTPWSTLELSLGYLALGGSPLSEFGQFQDNDEVVLQASYEFIP